MCLIRAINRNKSSLSSSNLRSSSIFIACLPTCFDGTPQINPAETTLFRRWAFAWQRTDQTSREPSSSRGWCRLIGTNYSWGRTARGSICVISCDNQHAESPFSDNLSLSLFGAALCGIRWKGRRNAQYLTSRQNQPPPGQVLLIISQLVYLPVFGDGRDESTRSSRSISGLPFLDGLTRTAINQEYWTWCGLRLSNLR